jgi:hypothetical protein
LNSAPCQRRPFFIRLHHHPTLTLEAHLHRFTARAANERAKRSVGCVVIANSPVPEICTLNKPPESAPATLFNITMFHAGVECSSNGG